MIHGAVAPIPVDVQAQELAGDAAGVGGGAGDGVPDQRRRVGVARVRGPARSGPLDPVRAGPVEV